MALNNKNKILSSSTDILVKLSGVENQLYISQKLLINLKYVDKGSKIKGIKMKASTLDHFEFSYILLIAHYYLFQSVVITLCKQL